MSNQNTEFKIQKATRRGVIPLIGARFGRLTVQSKAEPAPGWKAQVHCRCDCGETSTHRVDHLKSGRAKSCGCLNSELSASRNARHGDCHRKAKKAAEFNTWVGMNERCHNPNNPSFPRYGGRGIRVCGEWRQSYEAFLAHAGRRPSAKHSIDRINNDGNYEPGNVRWATAKEQCNNRSTSRRGAL